MSGCDCPPFDCRGLVERYRAGDRDAGEQLCRHFEPLVHALVARVLGPARREEWEDAAQVVFLHLLERLDRWAGQCPFCKWLAVVATRRLIDLRRLKAMLELEHPEQVPARAASPVDPETVQRIRQAVADLPGDWQKVWQLSLDGDNHDAIAARVGKSRRTVQYWLAAIRERLLVCLDDADRPGRPGPT